MSSSSTTISNTQWDTLFKDWDIPKKHQKKLIQTLNELYKLQYEKDLKSLKADVEYWKSKSKGKGNQRTSENPALNKEAMRLKTQLIEDMLLQITSFEQEQHQWKEYVDSFVNKHSMSLSDIYENFKTYSRQMNGNISQFRNEIDAKVRQYSSVEEDIVKTLAEMKSCIESSREIVDRKNKRILELESENTLLRRKIDEMKAEGTPELRSEVEKWKDISLLTIPLVELLNRALYNPSSFNSGNFSNIEPDSLPHNQQSQDHSYHPISSGHSVASGDWNHQEALPSLIPEASQLHEHNKIKVSYSERESSENTDSPIKISISFVDNEPSSISQESSDMSQQQFVESQYTTQPIYNQTPATIPVNQPVITPSFAPPQPFIQFLKCRRMVHHQIGLCPSKKPDHVDGYAKRARFSHPVALALQANSCIIAEAGNHCLRKLNLLDNLVSTLTSPQSSNISVHGKRYVPRIDCPGGITFDPSNPHHVFLTDLNEKKIFSVDIQKGALFPVKMKSPAKNTISTTLPFQNPYDCAMDEEGTSLYVTHDCGIAVIRLKSRDCSFIGSPSKQGYKDGHIHEALFDRPNGITFIGREVFVVCDSGNHVLRLVDLGRGLVKTIGGRPGVSCIRDGPLSESCFSSPRKISFLSSPTVQYLFVTEDYFNIRVVDMVNEVVRSIEMKPALDSPFGIAAKFGKHENNIHIYVADCLSHVVVHTEISMFSDMDTTQASEFLEHIQGDGTSTFNEADSELGNITDEF